MILETQPYRLATARDGKQCMEMVAEEIPDLLILDLLMPTNGWMGCHPRNAKQPTIIHLYQS